MLRPENDACISPALLFLLLLRVVLQTRVRAMQHKRTARCSSYHVAAFAAEDTQPQSPNKLNPKSALGCVYVLRLGAAIQLKERSLSGGPKPLTNSTQSKRSPLLQAHALSQEVYLLRTQVSPAHNPPPHTQPCSNGC